MRDLYLVIFLSAVALFAGGCLVAPLDGDLDGDMDEETTGSTSEGVHAATTASTEDEDLANRKVATSPDDDGVISDRTNVDTTRVEPNRPQPDPWTDLWLQTGGSVSSP